MTTNNSIDIGLDISFLFGIFSEKRITNLEFKLGSWANIVEVAMLLKQGKYRTINDVCSHISRCLEDENIDDTDMSFLFILGNLIYGVLQFIPNFIEEAICSIEHNFEMYYCELYLRCRL